METFTDNYFFDIYSTLAEIINNNIETDEKITTISIYENVF